MTITNWNIPWVNRKAWQVMTPAPTATTAWSFVITDRSGATWNALFVSSATVQYWYSFLQDAWVQIPSMALAWTFWAWACGTYSPWSNTYTATWWSTTTITTTSLIDGLAVWSTVRFMSWTAANIWLERTITNVSNNAGTVTLTLNSAVTSSVANTDTFVLSTWVFYIMNAWTIAAWIFKSFDVATWTVTSLWTTNLPASWWTDWKLVATPSNEVFATWTATAWASTTLTNSAKTWTTNQFTNHQIRITGGTWVGQIRTIASNTWTVITVSASWTVTPDATSTYSIEWNDDFLYLLGNNAVTMYRYSKSGNTWTVLSPWVARASTPIAWMSANWIWKTTNTTWGNESVLLDWKYIYSFRWGMTSVLDRYDIPWNTWSSVTYNYATETFYTWSSYDALWDKIFIRKDATNRFFYFDVPWNNIFPFSTLLQTDWTAVIWDKVWSFRYTDWVTNIDWLYSLANTWTTLSRIMIF